MRMLGRFLVALLFAFLPLPIVIVAISSFTETGYFTLPLDELSLRWYVEFLTDAQWLHLLAVSAGLAVLVALVSTSVALLGALVLDRGSVLNFVCRA